jgi:large exoprotein involved in heme utilization and adhesion
VSARSVGNQDAGRIAIDAGRSLLVVDSTIATDTDPLAGPEAAGGQIDIVATQRVELVDSRLTTSVQGRVGNEDGGDITIDPVFVIVNASEILAQAVLGNGGNIRIVAQNYLESSDSRVDASSELGVDGVVDVNAPDVQLKGELTRLPARFLDAAALLREHCAARVAGRGSFVIAGSEGRAAAPDRALPARMPLPGETTEPRGKGEGDSEAEVSDLRVAAVDCAALERAAAARGALR